MALACSISIDAHSSREAAGEPPNGGSRWDTQGEVILAWTANRETVSLAEVFASCMGENTARCTQAEKRRVARFLMANGWKRYQQRRGRQREWRYRRAVTSPQLTAPEEDW